MLPLAAEVFNLLLVLFLLQTQICSRLEAAEADSLPKEKIEQLVAPIALYPDPLLAQLLMASTYPLEVVQAARWRKANPKLSGKALEDALLQQPWDPSVKSLTSVPDTLLMMSEKLEWTQELGDALLAQQEDVLAAVQSLRVRAQAADQLKTTKQQKVVTQGSGPNETIIVEPADPDVIYLPIYDPAVVYGDWPYPDYPPYYWGPPGYSVGRVLSFAAGVAVGAAIWGRCDWDRRNISIDVDRYNRFNHTKISNNRWEHNATHRKGVAYRNHDVAQKFGKGGGDVRSREEFRGRIKDANAEFKGKDFAGKNALPDMGGRPDGIRPAGKLDDAKPGAAKKLADRPKHNVRPSSASHPKVANLPRNSAHTRAFDGVGNGHQVRQHSNRGKASRAGSVRPHSVSARPSGVHRGGGGGGRGGGRRR